MKKWQIFPLIAVFFFVCGGLFAQNAQTLNFGNVAAGRLNSGSEVWYRITPTQTGFISIETTGSTDTYMELYDANRNLLAEDDDSGEGYNARIVCYAASGQSYLIKVRGYNSSESGSYEIFAQYKPTPQAAELRVGGSASGNISAGGEYWYSVRTTSAGLLTVETTGSTDTYMTAYDSSYKFLDSDDDSGNGYNARIDINVTANQTYYFMVRGYSSSETGSYQIRAAMVTPAELRVGGSSVSGTISEDGTNWYSVRTTSRGLLVVETTGSIDTVLEAYTNSFEYLDYNDDGGQGYNARIEIFAEANQTYLFKLTAYESGRYQISAVLSSLPAPAELTIGREISANLAPGASIWYSVKPTSRGTLIVETTGSLDTYMEVYDSSYNLLDYDDDSGQGYNARIEISVQANQTYIFRVKGYDSSESGPFNISARIR